MGSPSWELDGAGVSVAWAGERLRVEAWGPDALRVRASPTPEIPDGPGALGPTPPPGASPSATAAGDTASVDNGRIGVRITRHAKPPHLMPDELRLTFVDPVDGTELLAEAPVHPLWPPSRHFRAAEEGLFRLQASFRAYDGERLYGLGQHQHGRLDQRGCVVDLVQRNGEVSVPLLVSSRGYGLLWNNPGAGRVELGASGTRWVADGTRRMDYWVVRGERAADILSRYADATGHAPPIPGWATGFWQSKLRYRDQEEVLEVARGFAARDLPLSVLVLDFLHWPSQGDWCFDPERFPDPSAMVAELADLGVRLVVSVWPTLHTRSATFAAFEERGLLVRSARGVAAHTPFLDVGVPHRVYVHHYDATDGAARRALWERLDDGYERHGVAGYWLDACEPEMFPGEPADVRYAAGPGTEVANLYPREHARAIFEGRGAIDTLSLCRSAWAGSQAHGAAVWSGDVRSDWAALRAQVPAGLNMGLSGIPWWTSDIGGFEGGDPDDPAFRELLVRWFQFAVHCPLCRLHGFRLPAEGGILGSGAPNEPWSFGEEVLALLRDQLRRRERLRPYLATLAAEASATGAPPMRTLWWEFPEDAGSWEVEDQFVLGPDVLVAPVLAPGATARRVYLPAGATWTDAVSGTASEGGRWLEVPVDLATTPVFLRDGRRPW